MSTLYDTLGIHPDATDEEIKAAYRKQAMILHPDREGGDNEKFVEAAHAYDVLSDPVLRKRYDETGRDDNDMRVPEEIAERGLRRFFDNFFASERDIETVDPVKRIIGNLKTTKAQGQRQINNAENAVKKYEKAMKRAKRKNPGKNIILDVLNARIARTKAEIAEAKFNIQVVNCMLNMLDDYEYDVDQVPIGKTMSAIESQIFGRSPLFGFGGS